METQDTKKIIKQGYLQKRNIKTWTKKWFVLYNGKIDYYTDNNLKNKPLGVINLCGCILNSYTEYNTSSFILNIPGKLYFLSAENQKEKDEWIKALSDQITINSYQLHSEKTNEILAVTNFPRETIDLYFQLFQIKYNSQTIDRNIFIEYNNKNPLYGENEYFWGRVFDFMSDNKEFMDFKKFCIGLDTLKKLSVNERLSLIFDLYDKDRDEEISLEDFYNILCTSILSKRGDNGSINPILSQINNQKLNKGIFMEYMNSETNILDMIDTCVEENLKQRSNHFMNMFSVFDDQVGGHKGKNQSMLHDKVGGCILKPLNHSELTFYRILKNAKKYSASLPFQYFPKFLGTICIPVPGSNTSNHYIILQNLLYGLETPCICDLKMGGNSSGTDPRAGIIKLVKQTVIKKVSTSGTLFFRMEGLKSWRNDNYITKNKPECNLFSEHELQENLAKFMSVDGTTIRSDIANIFIDKLNYLIEWFSVQKHIIFRSSSILLIYDAKSSYGDVKMIDFPHSHVQWKDPQKDNDYFQGLLNLKLQLEFIVDYFATKDNRENKGQEIRL